MTDFEKERMVVAKDIVCFSKIFSFDTRERIKSNIKKVKTIFNDDYVHPMYGRGALAEAKPSFFNSGSKKGVVGMVELTTSSKLPRNVRIHELWHALMFSNSVLSKDDFYLSHGAYRVKFYSGGRYEEKHVGIEEGCAEFFSKLAMITESAKKTSDSYSESILKNADYYVNTGNVICNNDVVLQGYFKSLEDIVRLLFIASRNDFGNYKFDVSGLLGRNDGVGIDCRIGPNGEWNYSQFVDSVVNSNLIFEEEFDKSVGNNGLSYEEISLILDDIFHCVMRNRGMLSADLQKKYISVVESIKKYYLYKLVEAVNIKQIITYDELVMIKNDFENNCSDVIKKHCGSTYSSGKDSLRPNVIR